MYAAWSGKGTLMARHGGVASLMAQAVREAQRAQRDPERAQLQAQRVAQRRVREAERARAAEEKERKRLDLEQRQADAEAMTADLQSRVEELEGLLAATLDVDDHIDFEALKQRPRPPVFDPGSLRTPAEPPTPVEQRIPPRPSGAKRLVPGAVARWESALQQAEEQFGREQRAFDERERERLERLEQYRQYHDRRVVEETAAIEAQHAEIDQFRREFESGDPDAIVNYFDLVLQASSYPDGFPQHFRIAYVPESKQLVIEYEPPTIDVVPSVRQYKFVKTRGEIVEAARPQTHIRQLYRLVVAQIPLRTIHEVFEADRIGRVETVVFNGYVDTRDKATGQRVKPTLVTLRTTRDVFGRLALDAIEPQACLQHLSASVSKKPEELAPVRPVLEFDMVDARFTEESDVVSGLDARPNLMDLSPTEFESLIQNLFDAWGWRLSRQDRLAMGALTV